MSNLPVLPTGFRALESGRDLALEHRFPWWRGTVLAAAGGATFLMPMPEPVISYLTGGVLLFAGLAMLWHRTRITLRDGLIEVRHRTPIWPRPVTVRADHIQHVYVQVERKANHRGQVRVLHSIWVSLKEGEDLALIKRIGGLEVAEQMAEVVRAKLELPENRRPKVLDLGGP